jgi:hypothetical protein
MADRSLFSFQKKSSFFLQKTSVFLKKDKENASFQLLTPAPSWTYENKNNQGLKNCTERIPGWERSAAWWAI